MGMEQTWDGGPFLPGVSESYPARRRLRLRAYIANSVSTYGSGTGLSTVLLFYLHFCVIYITNNERVRCTDHEPLDQRLHAADATVADTEGSRLRDFARRRVSASGKYAGVRIIRESGVGGSIPTAALP